MRARRVVVSALVVSTLMVASLVAGVASRTSSATSPLACAARVVSTWSLARLANETIVVSVNALDIGQAGPAVRAGFGGLLIFGALAPTSFPRVVATLQRETPNHDTMLVMTDQEGGGVERLTNLVATLPWAQTMGKNLSPTRITALARRVGLSMKAAGINTDLAPVLDVDGRGVYPSATNPDGYRSFSGVPSIVARDGVAFVNGLREAGVTSVVKHFPGLGYASGNTDFGPAATLPWANLEKTALVPFEAAIRAGVSAVMVSNATVPGLSALPSSISPVVVNVLRQRLGFKGLIMTDSLSAGAISARGLGVPAASLQAVAAGVDLVLAGSPPSSAASLQLAQATSNALQEAVTSNKLSRSTLAAAAAQVLASQNPLVCSVPTS